jgi:hypothetical protein
LVPIQPTVTFFNVTGTLEKNVTKLVHRWQYVADKFHEDIFTRIFKWIAKERVPQYQLYLQSSWACFSKRRLHGDELDRVYSLLR